MTNIKKQKILILAGPNGAGKTTFACEFLPKEAACPRFINVDLIAEGLSPFDPKIAEFQAGRLMVQEIAARVRHRESFAFETTLSGLRYARLIPQWRKKGFSTIYGLYFLSQKGCQVTDHISRQIKTLTGGKDVSVHTFRHTHISHALNRWGRYPSVVQKWVGHKKLETTQQYIHVSVEDLHREARKIGN